MENPFIIESIVRGAQLVDRAAEVEKVKATLTGGGKLFVIGPRRFGKTSILHTAADQLRQAGASVIVLNVEGFTSLELLVRAIVTGAANLMPNLKQATTSVRKFFARLNPSLSYNLADGTLDASLGLGAAEPAAQPALLIEALDNLERLAASKRLRIGLVLDEFQRLLTLGGAGIEGQLRAAVQLHTRVGYVFAGSQTALLGDMVNNPARPFYRLGEPLFIREIPSADWLDCFQRGFKQLKCQADADTFAHLYALAEGVPYHVQLLARACWDQINRQPKPRLTRADVDRAQQSLVQLFDPYHAALWASLASTQQRALALLARGTTVGLMAKQTLKQVDLTPGAMHKALLALERQSIIRRDFTNAAAAYRFEDPLFKAWIPRSTISA